MSMSKDIKITSTAMAMVFVLVSQGFAQTTNPEIVYLSNCELSNEQKSSEMDYYANTQLSQHGEFPAATAQVAQNGNVTWEGHTVVGTFPDNDHFTSVITDHNGPAGSIKGLGRNDFHAFVCRQDNLRVLYRNGDKTCNSVYYCQDQ